MQVKPDTSGFNPIEKPEKLLSYKNLRILTNICHNPYK